MTAIENRLIVLSLEPLTDADGLRAVIQSEIDKIRKCGGNEKDMLLGALYKWTYQVMTCRR